MTEIPKPIQGRKPGDRRVRVDRPYAPYFRYAGPGQLVAKEAASRPTTGLGLRIAGLRRALFGRPLSTYEEIGERLSKKKALAIFSSDAISSSAYATEEILLVLLAAGGAALYLSVEVSIAIAIMLAVVTTSYRQIGYAYPNGGGAYAVSRANLGKLPALVAAAALLVDYILTVAVSISSAVAQIVSAIPDLFPFTVVLCVLFVALMTLGNLRGIRESGNIFAVPTYLFVGAALLMIGLGLWQVLVLGQGAPYPELVERGAPFEAVTILLLLRAFAARLGGADRYRGHRERRPRVPAAGAAERRGHPLRHGDPAGRPVRRHHVRRRSLRHRAHGRQDGDRGRGEPGVRGRIRSASTCSRRSRPSS